MKLNKIGYIISLLLVVFMVGCNSDNTVSFNLDGRYCAILVRNAVQNDESSYLIIDINNNRYNDYEFKDDSLKSDFNLVINDTSELSYNKDTKCYYAETKINDDSVFGYYLLNQDGMYLYYAEYSEKTGYHVMFGYKLVNVNEYLNTNHYYIYGNSTRCIAFDENGDEDVCLGLIKNMDQLNEYIEKYYVTNNVSKSILNFYKDLDSTFFEKNAIIVYSTWINSYSMLSLDSLNVQNDKIVLNMKYNAYEGVITATVHTWSTIVVVEKNFINGANDVVVELVPEYE